MLPTPSTSHVDYACVYEPAEDSYLLLDTLSSPEQTTYLGNRFRPRSPSPLIVEVGVGSGVVLAFVAANVTTILGRPDALTLGVDVNSFACASARQTVLGAIEDAASSSMPRPAFLGCVNGDLGSSLRPGSVDLLIFNPPYVPSEQLTEFSADAGVDTALNSHEKFLRDSRMLALATDGGVDGMEVTKRLLAQVPLLLSARGVAYVLLCAQNKPEEVKRDIRGWGGGNEWTVDTVGTSGKTGGWEKLQIVRIARLPAHR